MEPITLDFALKAVEGVLSGPHENMRFASLSTDTRGIQKGCLFIALKGERFDGNDFIEMAFEKGAAACIAHRPDEQGRPVILTDDTRRALLKLAGAYRALFDIPVVGITGSVGKTSTKEMVYAVLSQKFKTHKNEGNLNNGIGLPLSVLGLDKGHQAAVFEMGMSGFGEISRLSAAAAPTIGVITNIGISHIEKLGSRENILKAKLEILDGLKRGGILILNGDDSLLQTVKAPADIGILKYGLSDPGFEAYAENVKTDEEGTCFDLCCGGRRYPARLGVCGRHHVYNALAAFLCGLSLGMRPEEAIEGFLRFEQTGMRQKIVRFHDILLIEDCYNASPDSMRSAFEVLASVKVRGRRIAVLGDMLELGASAPEAHLQVGMEAAKAADFLLAFGDNARLYCEGYERAGRKKGSCFHFDDKCELAALLSGFMREGDAVLFKGSRGMKLEEVIEKACEGWKTNG